MHTHTAKICWTRNGEPFTDGRYGRRHEWHFDGGTTVAAAASPQVVPERFTDRSCVDPEEAFVASLSSCHMLWFLDLASDDSFCVDRYEDAPEGEMNSDADDIWMQRVTLRPLVRFQGSSPTETELRALHETAHDRCFLANSVRSEVVVAPRTP